MMDEGEEAGLRTGDASPDAVRTQDGSTTSKADGKPRRRGALTPQSRNRIAAQLRVMYGAVVEQPVPDRFAELIARLESTERKGP